MPNSAAARMFAPQWGHGPEAVETPSTSPGFAPRSSRRNGATALRPWRHAWLGRGERGCSAPQWGHGPEAVETNDGGKMNKSFESAAMGPRP